MKRYGVPVNSSFVRIGKERGGRFAQSQTIPVRIVRTANGFGAWETIGFPWDGDDVSVHDADELAFYLRCLDNGLTPWGESEEEDE